MNQPEAIAPAIDFDALKSVLAVQNSRATLFPSIVNAPFEYKVATALLFLGIIVLLVVNEETGDIDRVALSDTEWAKNTVNVTSVPFNAIKIPLDYEENVIAKAVRTGTFQDTTDWKYLFQPALTEEQARINQASGGIAYSAVHPLMGNGIRGALIFSYFQYLDGIGNEQHKFMDTYAALINKRLRLPVT